MTTKEAIQAMLDGKKVGNKNWNSGNYMFFDGDTLKDNSGIIFNDLLMEMKGDWEIYEEPKPKQIVKMEKWLFEDKFGIKFIQDIEKDCVLCYCHEFQMMKVKLLDTYEVEL